MFATSLETRLSCILSCILLAHTLVEMEVARKTTVDTFLGLIHPVFLSYLKASSKHPKHTFLYHF